MSVLLTWNVRYFSQGAAGLTSTSGTVARVARTLAQLEPQPDVMALQEIDNHSLRSHLGRIGRRPPNGFRQVEHFVSLLNEESARLGGREYAVLFFRAHGHDKLLPLLSTGLAVLYRRDWVVESHNAEGPWHVTYHRIPQLKKLKQTRICAHARFALPSGGAFDLFNTHLSLPAFLQRHRGATGKRFGEAQNQVEEVSSVLQSVFQNADPQHTILVGDFNARPGSKVYRYIQENSPLRDAFAEAHSLTEEEVNTVPSAGFLGMKFRLDHIFSGPGIRFEPFLLGLPWDARHPMRGLSDHAPLMARFELK